MVDKVDIEQRCGGFDAVCKVDIRLAWFGTAGWVVMSDNNLSGKQFEGALED